MTIALLSILPLAESHEYRKPAWRTRAACAARPQRKISRRNRLFALLFGVAAVAAVAVAVHWFISGRYIEETDNAYVGGNVVPIAAQVAGTAREVLVGNTQYVKAGQPLVRLDDSEARIALGQAEGEPSAR